MYLNRKGIVFGVKDTWSLDRTLSPIILSSLIKFKECSAERKGVPVMLLCELFPDVLHEYTNEQMKEGEASWIEILDTMIYSFNLKNEPKIQDYDFKFNTDFGEKEDNDTRTMSISHTNDDEYQRYREDEKIYNEKVKEGHALFGKYLSCLWW